MSLLTFSIKALAMLAAIVAAIAFVSHGAAKTPAPPAIVIGFVGGYVSSDNIHHAEVQLAAALRTAYPAGVDVETYQNHHYEDAHQRILALLDVDHDGKLSSEQKRAARIILYGHSWGAAAALALARELNADEIPVRLTIQVDSVAFFHQNDSIIPPNVEKAVNFYQPHGKLHGQKQIKAADPERTKIIGNYEFDYSKDPIKCKGYPWWDRYFAHAHTEIECDPKVWAQIEDMVRAELPTSPSPSSQPAEPQ